MSEGRGSGDVRILPRHFRGSDLLGGLRSMGPIHVPEGR